MLNRPAIVLSASLLIAVPTAVLAQAGPGYQSGSSLANQDGSGQDHPEQRSLSRQLRQAGFRHIRILEPGAAHRAGLQAAVGDADFVVRAETFGHPVLIVVNPVGQGFSGLGMGTPPSDEARGTWWHQSKNALSPDQVRAFLHGLGFSNISALDRNGNVYTGMADRYGEQEDWAVDARGPRLLQPRTMTNQQIANMLRDQGWNNVHALQWYGDTFSAQASRNGRNFALQIDAATGDVVSRTATQ